MRRKKKTFNDSPQLHFVLSTSCNVFQYWQSELLFNSAMHVGQKGLFTQIVVGCEESEGDGVDAARRTITHDISQDAVVSKEMWAKTAHPNVNRFFAPAVPQAKEFPWFNKPYSFNFWMTHANITGDTIIILDPDEFFLRQFVLGKVRKARKPPPPGFLLDGSEVNDQPRKGFAVAEFYDIAGEIWNN